MPKLKKPDPCKHCGAVPSVTAGPRLVEQGHTWNGLRSCEYYVKCLTCGIMTCSYHTPGEALAVWDRTPEEGGEK